MKSDMFMCAKCEKAVLVGGSRPIMKVNDRIICGECALPELLEAENRIKQLEEDLAEAELSIKSKDALSGQWMVPIQWKDRAEKAEKDSYAANESMEAMQDSLDKPWYDVKAAEERAKEAEVKLDRVREYIDKMGFVLYEIPDDCDRTRSIMGKYGTLSGPTDVLFDSIIKMNTV